MQITNTCRITFLTDIQENLIWTRPLNFHWQATKTPDKLMHIGPQACMDTNSDAMPEICNDTEQAASFKGFAASAADAPIIEIPDNAIIKKKPCINSRNIPHGRPKKMNPYYPQTHHAKTKAKSNTH